MGLTARSSIGRVGHPQPGGPARRLNPDDLGDHLDRLFRAAWALCGDRHDAEDLVQETCAVVLARPRWVRGGDDLGYLLRALRNTHVSRLRTASRRPPTTELGDRAERRPRWDADVNAELGALFHVISELPAGFRDALVAVDLVGLTYREAARALRVREATITSRLHRARLRVAEHLEETGR